MYGTHVLSLIMLIVFIPNDFNDIDFRASLISAHTGMGDS